MKRYKVVPSKAPVTSIKVEGVPWHYFHSNALGRCRAIIISPAENLPVPIAPTPMAIEAIEESHKQAAKTALLSKGEKIAMLMDCNDRLGFRFAEAWVKFQNASDKESKAFWLAKSTRIQRALTRISKKIANIFED